MPTAAAKTAPPALAIRRSASTAPASPQRCLRHCRAQASGRQVYSEPNPCKRALELNEVGWKQREIAEALGISKAAVSQ